MRSRLLGLAVLLSMPVLVAGQSGPRVPKGSRLTYTPPRTPWGDPDLQGVWPGTARSTADRAEIAENS